MNEAALSRVGFCPGVVDESLLSSSHSLSVFGGRGMEQMLDVFATCTKLHTLAQNLIKQRQAHLPFRQLLEEVPDPEALALNPERW